MENDQLPEKMTPADSFRAWADKIEKNAPEDFAGAFIIIPPQSEPIASLMIGDNKELATFFAVVKSKIDEALVVINDKQRQPRGFG